jgi:peptidyl-Lys metalloendopeptidase
MLTKIRQTRARVLEANCVVGEHPKKPFAHVHRDDPSTIYLDEQFWDSERAGTDRQGGVVVHEASHFGAGAATLDQKNAYDGNAAYGHARCETLATEDPARARANGDSVEYFVENAPR